MCHMQAFWCVVTTYIILGTRAVECTPYRAFTGGVIRRYYLAAVEVDWDYAPSGRNLINNQTRIWNSKFVKRVDRIGRIYKKVVYRQFTDSTFRKQVPSPAWLGIVGPILRAEVDDTLEIYFKNMATGRNFSIHPHGLLYTKDSEGALYKDGTGRLYKADDGVPPGSVHTYRWKITQNFAPAPTDDACVSWAYHSHTSSTEDISTGLVGILLTCKKGILKRDNTRRDVDGDLIIYAEAINENQSWKIEENLLKCGNPSICRALRGQTEFVQSNIMHSFNGYSFGNLPSLRFPEGVRIACHIFGMNAGIHGIRINGQTFTYLHKRLNTIPVYPATFMSPVLKPVSPGRWLVQSTVYDDFAGGMLAFLTVYRRTYRTPRYKTLSTRTYYLAAEECNWNYAPSGVNLLDRTRLTTNGSDSASFFTNGPHRIGGIYKKVHYVQYEDSSCTKKRKRTADEEHLGILGPVLRVAVGEKIKVVFKNKANRPYSFIPHGVILDKDNEGALYYDQSLALSKGRKIARPGETVVYWFSVTEDVSPTAEDPDCITSMYHSAVDPIKDTNSGLIGPLLICKAPTPHYTHKSLQDNYQKSVDKILVLFFATFDENRSWYIDYNIQRFTSDPQGVNKKDGEFMSSNRMHSINGLMYGNLNGDSLSVCLGQRVSWHVTSVGGFAGLHGVHFHGNTLVIDGSNKDADEVIPGSSFTGIMEPDNPGTWNLVCRTNFHLSTGMTAQYKVNRCNDPKIRHLDRWSGKVRYYYIAVLEGDWDYAPGKMDLITGKNLSDPTTNGNLYVRQDNGFLGSKYRKAVYREFTDATFRVMKSRNLEENHLGILGPVIRAEVYDTIKVVFLNKATRPYSIHPHGVFYDKLDEGVPFFKGNKKITLVQPHRSFIYTWKVPERAGPSTDKTGGNCVSWMYYSAVDLVRDVNTGLVGPLVICRPGILSEDGRKRTDVDREFVLLFNIMDENQSWLFYQNVQYHSVNKSRLSDPVFIGSNRINMINGYIYGNLPGLTMEVNEVVVWHIIGLGSAFDIHTVHFHGETVLNREHVTHRSDVIEVFPGTYETVEMRTDNPGTWILHCHVSSHINAGMEATYTIEPKRSRKVIGTSTWIKRIRRIGHK